MTGHYLYSKLWRSGVSDHIGTGGTDPAAPYEGFFTTARLDDGRQVYRGVAAAVGAMEKHVAVGGQRSRPAQFEIGRPSAPSLTCWTAPKLCRL
jgi:hypothetical protein